MGSFETYVKSIEREPFEEKDGLVFDSGGFCAFLKDETTASSLKAIEQSGLNGTRFLPFPIVPLQALFTIDMQNDKRYVTILETLCDANILLKLLRAIGFHDVRFCQSHNKGLIGVKTTDGHITRQGVMAPLKSLPFERKTKADAGESKVRILSLAEVIRRYDLGLTSSLQDMIDLKKEPERIERIS